MIPLNYALCMHPMPQHLSSEKQYSHLTTVIIDIQAPKKGRVHPCRNCKILLAEDFCLFLVL